MDSLPEDALIRTLGFLDTRSFIAIERICRSYSRIVKDIRGRGFIEGTKLYVCSICGTCSISELRTRVVVYNNSLDKIDMGFDICSETCRVKLVPNVQNATFTGWYQRPAARPREEERDLPRRVRPREQEYSSGEA